MQTFISNPDLNNKGLPTVLFLTIPYLLSLQYFFVTIFYSLFRYTPR
jgi:hypothetical protein